MKKTLSLLLILTVSLSVFAQKDAFKIKMKINGMKDSACYLINYFGQQRYYKDTAQFNTDGLVIFEGKEALPGGIYGVYTGNKLLFEIVLNNEPIVHLETDTTDYIGNMKVLKSKENSLFFEHLQLINSKQKIAQPLRKKLASEKTKKKEKEQINEQLIAIGKDINVYRNTIIEQNPDLFITVIFKTMKEIESPEFEDIKNDSLKRLMKYQYLKTHYFDNFDFSDPRINYTPLYHNKLDQYFKSVVYQIPDSITKEVDMIIGKAKANDEMYKYTVHFLLRYYEQSKIMGMDGVFSYIGLNYYTHDNAFWADSTQIENVQERARKIAPLMIGKQAINLTLLDSSSTKWIDLTRDVKADYTVLVFWDPDCGHCKKELPKLAKYIDSVKTTVDVKVYSVSSDHSDSWREFINEYKLDFINVGVPKDVYKDQNKATELVLSGKTDLNSLNFSSTYDIYSTPQIYLLDKTKKIIGKKLDTDLLEKVINQEVSLKK
jgi:thiol-disulfide isomerase/thioredoxin